MQAKKHWILAALIAAAALTYGLSCRNEKSKGKKRNYAQPVSAWAQARNHRGRIAFILQLQEANGEKLRSLVLPTGKRPSPPEVTITDAEGNEVYTFSMRYG